MWLVITNYNNVAQITSHLSIIISCSLTRDHQVINHPFHTQRVHDSDATPHNHRGSDGRREDRRRQGENPQTRDKLYAFNEATVVDLISEFSQTSPFRILGGYLLMVSFSYLSSSTIFTKAFFFFVFFFFGSGLWTCM